MTPSDWIAFLGIILTILTAAIGALTTFLWRQSLKLNGLELRQKELIRRMRNFESGMKELGDFLFRRNGGKPRSDEG